MFRLAREEEQDTGSTKRLDDGAGSFSQFADHPRNERFSVLATEVLVDQHRSSTLPDGSNLWPIHVFR